MDKRLAKEAVEAPEELGLRVLADKAFQEHILTGISRAFACSVPALPESLRPGIANLYVLSRITEIIAGQARLSAAEREEALRALLAAVESEAPVQELAAELGHHLPAELLPAERELIRNLPRIQRVALSLPLAHQQVIQRCARSLCETRIRFQPLQRPDGLPSLHLLEEYCAGTSGAVAEATSALLCRYSPRIARHSGELLALGPSFGQGVQLTHLLKSVWDERARGVCWLPRNVFLAHGCSLDPALEWSADPGFHAGLAELIAHACAHLRDGLAYTLLIPADEDGIRRFCAWPIGVALATLQRLHRHLDFTSAEEVKLSRAAIRALAGASRFAVSHNWLLKGGFALGGWGLAEEARRTASLSS